MARMPKVGVGARMGTSPKMPKAKAPKTDTSTALGVKIRPRVAKPAPMAGMPSIRPGVIAPAPPITSSSPQLDAMRGIMKGIPF